MPIKYLGSDDNYTYILASRVGLILLKQQALKGSCENGQWVKNHWPRWKALLCRLYLDPLNLKDSYAQLRRRGGNVMIGSADLADSTMEPLGSFIMVILILCEALKKNHMKPDDEQLTARKLLYQFINAIFAHGTTFICLDYDEESSHRNEHRLIEVEAGFFKKRDVIGVNPESSKSNSVWATCWDMEPQRGARPEEPELAHVSTFFLYYVQKGALAESPQLKIDREFRSLLLDVAAHCRVIVKLGPIKPGMKIPFRHLPVLKGHSYRRRMSLEMKNELTELTTSMSRSNLSARSLVRSVQLWATTLGAEEYLKEVELFEQEATSEVHLIKKRKHIKGISSCKDDFVVPVMWNYVMSANRLAQDPKPSVLCLGCDGVSVFGEDILKMPMYLPEPRYRVGIWAADQVVDVGLWVAIRSELVFQNVWVAVSITGLRKCLGSRSIKSNGKVSILFNKVFVILNKMGRVLE